MPTDARSLIPGDSYSFRLIAPHFRTVVRVRQTVMVTPIGSVPVTEVMHATPDGMAVVNFARGACVQIASF